MSTPKQLFDEYVQLRKNGLDAPNVLQQLRGRIQMLPANDRATIVKQVKVWESQEMAKVSTSQIKPLTPKTKSVETNPVVKPFVSPFSMSSVSEMQEEATLPDLKPPTKPLANQIACPKCGKMNPRHEVLCFSCGHMLQPQNSPFATVALNADGGRSPDPTFFGTEATLVLQLRGTNKMFPIQPQKQDHELIIGRSDGSTMQPDLDLVDNGAGQLGVSRMHAAIQYSSKHNTVSISDLNSANGTYVNGQKLHPNEVRVLRHNDELRLGRMVFQALFQAKR